MLAVCSLTAVIVYSTLQHASAIAYLERHIDWMIVRTGRASLPAFAHPLEPTYGRKIKPDRVGNIRTYKLCEQ